MGSSIPHTSQHVPPYLATVTYLTSSGAPTCVFTLAADAHGKAVISLTNEVPPCCASLSFPRRGRHLLFDGRLLHGAPHELARQTEAPTWRGTVLVNLWARHKPCGVLRLPASKARELYQVCNFE